MAVKQPSFAPNGPPTSQTPAQLQLPPPQTFDILPALHELFSRPDHSSTEPTSGLVDNTTTDSEDIGALYAELQPLEPKELPTEVLQIKAMVRKALKELEKLPDMERSVEEQGQEIEFLRGRIRRQKEMLGRLGELARDVQRKAR